MAVQQDITSADMFFIGEDKKLRWPALEQDPVTKVTIPVNISGWDLRLDVRKEDKSPDPALITKTIGAGIEVVGVYDPDPAQNTQKIEVTFADTDTNALKPRTYRYALKRLTDGSEAVLVFGNFVLRQSTVR